MYIIYFHFWKKLLPKYDHAKSWYKPPIFLLLEDCYGLLVSTLGPSILSTLAKIVLSKLIRSKLSNYCCLVNVYLHFTFTF